MRDSVDEGFLRRAISVVEANMHEADFNVEALAAASTGLAARKLKKARRVESLNASFISTPDILARPFFEV